MGKIVALLSLFICFSCISSLRNSDQGSENIPSHSGTELYKFVSIIYPVNDSSVIYEENITGLVSVAATVDENGDVCATAIKESIKPKIDSLVISAVLDSKFRKMMGPNKQLIKYIIEITHIFYHGQILNPLVNGATVLDEYNESSVVLNKSSSISNDTRRPVIDYKATPLYPERARRVGAQGRVVVGVEIKENGQVGNMEIVKADNILLILSSLDAASKCTFKPAKLKGKNVRVKMSIPFDYRLKS